MRSRALVVTFFFSGILAGATSGPSVADAHEASPSSGLCGDVAAAPPVRRAGRLTVESPPRKRAAGGHRLRTHAQPERTGSFWFGPEVPAFVPLSVGAMTLEILDPSPSGYLALYRDVTYERCGFQVDAVSTNCAAEVRLYDRCGHELAAVPLNRFMSRRDQLEVQDVRYADGTLYFNEACQSYSRYAGGRCSSLVALDPFANKVLWRTPPLVSNDAFVVVGDFIVAAYGFTAEESAIRIVRRRDGVIVDKKPLPSAADDGLEVRGGRVSVNLYNMLGRKEFEVVGLDGPSPKLAPVARPAR